MELWQQLEPAFDKMNAHAEEFCLHDGPPYANGHLHLGHALNKVLKDAVCKSQRLMGKHSVLRPGWDCHGLPIELAVEKALEGREVSGLELKQLCEEYARAWVQVQAGEFQQMGVLASYRTPYLTCHQDYEAGTLRVFGEMVRLGLVHRMKKTVPWCRGCHTSLATAEMEYAERKDPSLLVLFPLCGTSAAQLVEPFTAGERVSLCVFTTTPWTLPLNQAVAVHPTSKYALVRSQESGWLVVVWPLQPKLAARLEILDEPVCFWDAESLAACRAQPPWGASVPVVADHMVRPDTGTGAVHLAPGVGPEDYAAAMRHKLPVFCPVDAAGVYTSEAPLELAGRSVVEVNPVVRAHLEDAQLLVSWTTEQHEYPHCWRCKLPLLFRATEQYFVDLAASGLSDKACALLGSVQFQQEHQRATLERYVRGRSDWCLSRARVWGVPLPACHCTGCGELELSVELVELVAQQLGRVGVAGWDSAGAPSELLGRGCRKCGEALVWETDVLDVWFDSGCSYATLFGEGRPTDLYLEGEDQYRGWFQSSLLVAAAVQDTPPTHKFATHAFVVDHKGRKMSKSVGNVVKPFELHQQYPNVLSAPCTNPDVLRLWALNADFATNVKMSSEVVSAAATQYSKLRATLRFVLQNLRDFDPTELGCPPPLSELDRLTLRALHQMVQSVTHSWSQLDFAAGCQTVELFCRETLSKRYFVGSKPALYFLPAKHPTRRACQLTLSLVLHALLAVLSPSVSFLTEELWAVMPAVLKPADVLSVHLLPLPDTHSWLLEHMPEHDARELDQLEGTLERVRSTVHSHVDAACQGGVLLNQDQASCVVGFQPHEEPLAQRHLLGSEAQLCDYLGVASVRLVPMSELCGARVLVERAGSLRCQRCRRFVVLVESDERNLESALRADLCEGCAEVVGPEELERVLGQECDFCGAHGHVESECKLKAKADRKSAQQKKAKAV